MSDTTTSPAPAGMLRDHDFRMLWIGETVSMTGSAATTVALPLVAVITLRTPVWVVGVLEAAAWAPFLAFGLFAGAWVDQARRRPVLQAANLTAAALFATVPAAAWAGWLTVWQLVVVALAGGTGRVFYRVASQPYLADVVSAGRLGAANGWLSGSASAAEVGGPGLAGLMAQTVGAVAAVAADAVSYLFAAVCLQRIRTPEPARQPSRANAGLAARIGAGLAYVAADRWQRTITTVGTLGNVALAGLNTLLVVFLVRTVGLPPGWAGVLLGGYGAGGIAGAAAAGRVAARLGTGRALLAMQAVAVPLAAATALTGGGARLAWFAAAPLLAAGTVASSVIARTWRLHYTPADMRGRVSSVVQVATYGGIPAGALAAGWAGTTFGVRAALWAVTAAMLAPALVLMFSPARTVRELPIHTETEDVAQHDPTA